MRAPSDEPRDAEVAATEKSCALPASDCELLYGSRMIARWLGLTYGQAKPLIENDTIPTFKIPGHTVRCALKSALNARFREWSADR